MSPKSKIDGEGGAMPDVRSRSSKQRARAFNERLAVKATAVFGSMGTTYAFFAYGFIPVLLPTLMVTLLYWSNTVQLWSLPLLMVGQNVTSRVINTLIRDTHEVVLQEHTETRELLAGVHELVTALHTKVVTAPEEGN